MRRWHEDLKQMKRQKKVWRSANQWIQAGGSLEPTENEKAIYNRPVGRFRKRHALDCGHTRCFRCHCDKILKDKSKQQQLSDISYREQLGGV